MPTDLLIENSKAVVTCCINLCRILTELEENASIEVNNPGCYKTVCVELDMAGFAVNTLIEVIKVTVIARKRRMGKRMLFSVNSFFVILYTSLKLDTVCKLIEIIFSVTFLLTVSATNKCCVID